MPMSPIVQMNVRAMTLQRPLAANRMMIAGDASQAMNLRYEAFQAAQQANGPLFPRGVAPNGPGPLAGADNQSYFVPAARVAFRPNLPGVRDLFFDKQDAQWILQATIELVRPDGVSADAIALPIDNFIVSIDPGDGAAVFAFTKVTPLPVEGRAADVALVLRAEAVVDPNLGLNLLRQHPNAVFVISADVHFQQQLPAIEPRPHPPGPVQPFPRHGLPLERLAAVEITPALAPALAPAPAPASAPAVRAFRRGIYDRMALDPGFLTHIWGGPPRISAMQTRTLQLSVDKSQNGACFPSDLVANKPIYAELLGDDGTSSAVWTQETGQSWTRACAGLNRYDVLPDGFALAIDPDTLLPAMDVLLVQGPPASPGGSAAYTVRVRFAIAPQLDDARLDQIRAALRAAHGIPYASLNIGDYGSAVFTPSGLFANLPGFQSSTAGGDAGSGARTVDAANGFELILDCSLEFYTLLSNVLKSPAGLRGNVRFQLTTGKAAAAPGPATPGAPPPADPTTMVDVPVRLALSGAFEVGLVAKMPTPAAPGAASVDIEISNPLNVAVTIGAVLPTFLLMDKRPDLASLATPGAATPPGVTIPPNGTAAVAAGARDGGALPPFTALVANFADLKPAFDPDALLDHFHQLASAAGVSSTVNFSCYLLRHPEQTPTTLAGLIGMKVQVQRAGGGVMDVPLTLDRPVCDLALPYSFHDLLQGMSLDQPTFAYRFCSVFPDHVGPWSDWIPNTGRNVLVTPGAA
jgi:hypothetical protein